MAHQDIKIRVYNIRSKTSSKIFSLEIEDYSSEEDFIKDVGEVDCSKAFVDQDKELFAFLLGLPDVGKMIENANRINYPYEVVKTVSDLTCIRDLDKVLEEVPKYYIGEFNSVDDFLKSYMNVTPPNPYGYWVEKCTNIFTNSNNYFFRKYEL